MPLRRAVAICDSLQREMEILLAERKGEQAALIVFPGQCHKARAADCTFFCEGVPHGPLMFDAVDIFNGGCFAASAALAPQCNRCTKHSEQLCFYMLADRELVDAFTASGAYIVSPGWLRKWRQYMREWGLDQETACQMFHESTNRIVLLDTGVFPETALQLKEFAAFLRMPYEVVPVGLGFFREYVNGHLH